MISSDGKNKIHILRNVNSYSLSNRMSCCQEYLALASLDITLFDFVKKHCILSLKKARFQPVDWNSKEKIQERLDWIHKWEKTDMDFTTNCVVLDESAFHINLKRSMAWSKKGSPAVVTVPKTRAKTTAILGPISAQGLIKCSLRLPQPPSNKKRKQGEDVGRVSKGTVMGHYVINYIFLCNTCVYNLTMLI
ncbi:hypothetical protein PHYBLDRAFT_167941 [Phycomyces blakesleeanus NRRL 1555(-)]|uniref:Homeodomain-like DNA binding domain-containing transcription factor n=1 Tax=Phycomyces blakesleeanus (strain ATCC 8743b / DSM 1359 / FGSC 10004 / NBRC 33097 / NRRL 1555) TaxID=763407 RepID=A0A162UEK3_PHYB8|nr:hypothetical protein PHYBLDRAFT_167941 [Phycomyces blakesleeanus NRRL 1555(-)]OAD74533.1 hypothetical protein PHYBLDRAFT_167941 [Phycomyces blakesleeanus NRRL 1555(-)]|eukprot:XP_018292573.1 hypothetical protein PHYBLDRAFT_167941 [Phycomyces blakesleeanus NRRL 1555(-)]